MRKSILSVLLFIGAVFTFSVFGQEAPPVDEVQKAAFDWLLVIIPAGVPVLVAIGKKLIPNIPTAVLPIAAAALGVGIDQIAALATTHESSILLSALLGSAGVGLREILDQLKKLLPANR